VRDEEGKPYCVRYDQVKCDVTQRVFEGRNSKQTIAELKSAVAQRRQSFESKIAEQEKQIEALASGRQKVSAQIEMSRSAAQMVDNNQ
jgi:uncharacterized coiled-coil protein SlyX